MRISVAMGTYNGSRFLDEQLSSISRQSRLPDELIICDDCSRDDTLSRLQHFAEHSSFPVRIVVNQANLGPTRNFEQAISLCQGEIVALSDQDDIWKEHRLQKTEEVFARNPSAGLVFTDADIIGPDSVPVGARLWSFIHFGRLQQFQLRHKNAARALLRHNLVTGATMAFRATLRDVALPIPDIWVQDGWIALITSFFYDVVPIKEPLIQYRKHPEQKIGFTDGLRAEAALAKTTPPSHFHDRVQQYEAAYARLLPHAKTEKQKSIIKCIAAKIRHLSTRAHMPGGKVARIPVVFRELATMRYTLYSRGIISAARDLFVE